jgi:hypothetical protein
MLSSGMWRIVVIVRTNYSEERVASIFRVEKISGRRKGIAVDSQLLA